MLSRLHQAGVPLSWVVANSVYGGHLELRTWLEAHQLRAYLNFDHNVNFTLSAH